MSVYIPRMEMRYTEEMVRIEFHSKLIGYVKCVDFTPLHKTPGFDEKVVADDYFKAAFVHFEFIYPRLSGNQFKKDLENRTPYPLYIEDGTNKYWLILPNKNPIPRTMMNNSQIVENCRYLEKKVQEQEETIRRLETKLEGVHQVVYQLLGGLFNPTTQRGVLDSHLDCLFPLSLSDDNLGIDESKWTTLPTTRQGDECENRIQTLEKRVINLESDLNWEPQFIAKEEAAVQTEEEEEAPYDVEQQQQVPADFNWHAYWERIEREDENEYCPENYFNC